MNRKSIYFDELFSPALGLLWCHLVFTDDALVTLDE